MKFSYLLIIAALIFSTTSCSEETMPATFDKVTMLQGYAEDIELQFSDLKQKADEFETLANAFDTSSTQNDFEAIQSKSIELIKAYNRAKVYDVGSLKSFLYIPLLGQWPARYFIIDGQINGDDEINEASIQALGANAKGIYAIEYLLFKDQASSATLFESFTTDELAQNRINYVKYAAKSIAKIANDIDNHWNTTMKAEFLAATENGQEGSDNRLYNQSIFVICELYEIINTANRAKAENDIDPNQSNLIGWSSQQTNAFVSAALDGVIAVFNGSENKTGFADYLAFANAQWEDGTFVADAVNADFESMKTNLAANSLESSIQNQTADITNFLDKVRSILAIYQADLVNWLAFTLIVSDKDGD